MNKTDITVATFDSIVNEFIEYYRSKDLNGNVQFQKEIDFMCSELKHNAKILDAGTAIGDYPKYLTEKMYEHNFEVIGIDASKNMIEEAKKNAPQAQFKVMDIRNINFDNNYFDAIICLATLTYVDDIDCKKILDKFDKILKREGLIVINVIEWLNEEKEIFDVEQLNPNYMTYINKYKKEFFVNYFENKNYSILKFFDNPFFNISKLKVKGKIADSNQFSIIVKKK